MFDKPVVVKDSFYHKAMRRLFAKPVLFVSSLDYALYWIWHDGTWEVVESGPLSEGKVISMPRKTRVLRFKDHKRIRYFLI